MKNIAGMLQKAQALQAKMSEMHAGLKTREVVGSSGQGKVKVTMNGNQDVTKIVTGVLIVLTIVLVVILAIVVKMQGDAQKPSAHAPDHPPPVAPWTSRRSNV